MLRNYLTVAFRNLLRHKGYSAINIVGLAAGMACCTLVFLYVWHELNYDTYHPDHERIYRISTQGGTEAEAVGIAGCSENVAERLRANFPEVEQVFRIQPERPRTVRAGDLAVQVENIKYADNDLLTMFDMGVVHGDPAGALVRPGTAVLTRSIAERLFGEANPVGQSILVDTARYEITAIVENSRTDSHLKFGIMLSWISMEEAEWRHGWDGGFFKTYVKLAERTDPADFERRIAMMVHENAGEDFHESGRQAILFLQPVNDIHLHSNLRWEDEAPGNVAYVYIFIAVGVIVLFIACMNFMNLATARSAGRAAEVGMRKVAGARRGQLIGQFLGETTLTALMSMVVALILVDLALSGFNELAGTGFSPGALFSAPVVFSLLGVVVIAGGLAGIYPALVLSSFRPVQALKSSLTGQNGGRYFRGTVVVVQFTLAVVLTIGTITVYRQLDYMRGRPLGIDLTQKLILEMPRGATDFARHSTLKNEFKNNPRVLGATFSSSVPGRWNYQWRTWATGGQQTNVHAINWYGVDRDFIDQYGIELAAGETFGPDCRGAMCEGIVLNEAAVQVLGWDAPETAITGTLFDDARPICGVAKNFHIRGLQTPVEPMAMFIMGDDFRYLTLTVEGDDLASTMKSIETTYNELLPGQLFNFFFLDRDFDQQYHAEERLGTIFGAFAMLGLIVAALGLFGLASYTAQQRTKEIGVRKALGASVGSVICLLTREILILIVVANAVAWPIAYLTAGRWLESFAFRTSLDWVTFALAGLFALLIAAVSVGYQALRAARSNPVKALRYE